MVLQKSKEPLQEEDNIRSHCSVVVLLGKRQMIDVIALLVKLLCFLKKTKKQKKELMDFVGERMR